MESKWKGWLEGVRTGKKLPKKNQLLILLLAGVLLLVIAFPIPEEGEKNGKEKKETETGEDIGDRETISGIEDAADYEKYLENKTAGVLETVDGVGRAEVMITLKSSSQKIVEKDSQSTGQTVQESDSEGGTRATEDKSSDKTSVYAQGSDGSQTPYVSKEISPEVEGVVVIADGGDNPVVVQDITEAVQALFGVEAHKIKIMKRADT